MDALIDVYTEHSEVGQKREKGLSGVKHQEKFSRRVTRLEDFQMLKRSSPC